MWNHLGSEEPVYWLFFYYYFFAIKIWGACDKSILKSFYNNDPLCGEPWFLRHRTRDKNFVYSHDSTYLMTWSWMKNLLMRVWPSNTKVRDKKTKEFYVANYDPLYPFPLWISATLEILFSSCQTWDPWHVEVVKRKKNRFPGIIGYLNIFFGRKVEYSD